MFGHASGASNGSTSSSPFLGTQYSSPFGTAVGNSNTASGALNGSTSAPSVFANQRLNPFGVGTALNGSTSAPSVFANQSLNPFGWGTGATTVSPFGSSANAASCASFGCTSSSPFFANQSSGPFRTAVATNASTSGQTSSSFGGFGVATSTTPLFGHLGPSFNTSRGSSFTTPESTLQPSIFRPAGGGPATADNSCGGTRAPYRPTPDEENLPSWNNASRVLTSISAMNCYCNKSHEELRLEDYKQTRNGGATTVSPFCSSANAASCASFGCTSSSPFFANQSSGPFGTAVGVTTVSPFCSSANAASCASFGCTSSSPSFANQSFGPFGTAAATNASTSGQTSSSFGGFGVAATSTTALFGHLGPSFNTFRGASFTTPASTLQPSIFRPAGGGPATADNSCGGTRAPYRPTPDEENLPSWNNHNRVLNSISAMNCYCNKSHEELRLEDYNQTRNRGLFSASHVPGVSNPLSSHVSWLPPPCEPLASTFNRSSENPIQRTDPSSSLGSDKNCTTPVQTSPVQTSVAQTLPVPTPTVQTSPVQTSVAQTLPVPTPTTTTTMSNQTINVNLNDTTLSITVSGGASFIPITLAFIPQYPQVSNPTSALPLLQPEITPSNPRMILLNPTSSASTTNPANAHLSTIAGTTSHVSLSAGVLEEQITNLGISAPPAPTNASPSGSASPSSIPKGLEMIVEHLGFNPWEGKSHLQDSKDGQILLCEDASDDADILSLAEFAVEQHNAMEQDRKVELLKVTAACLETVDGGRYHIVLEAKMGKAASSGVCVYAVVLRKKTDRPTPLIVLERWLFNSRFD